MNIHTHPTRQALSQAAAEDIARILARAQGERGIASIALAGGSTPKGVYHLLAEPPLSEQVDWQKVEIFFGDERCVPADAPDSNFRMAHETLLSKVCPPTEHVHVVQGELPPETAAQRYEEEIRETLGETPRFDLVLLGMGEDGHTASLFPATPDLDGGGRLVIATESPKPPKDRITLTLPAINSARHVIFLVSGKSKRDALERVWNGDEALPASHVRPRDGELVWHVDEEAKPS